MIKSKYVALQNTYNPWWLPTGVLSSTCIGAFLSKGASDFSHSLINLTGSSINLSVPQIMPSFSQDDGWIFDTATTKRLAMNGVTASATIFVKFTDCGTSSPSSQLDTSLLYTLDRYYVRPNTGSGFVWSCDSIFESPVLPDMTNGVIALKRTKGYRNGVLDCTLSRDKYMNFEWTIGRTQSKIQAIAVYNVSLTDAQILAVSNAMNAL